MLIAILAFPDSLMIDVIGPLEVFSEAALLLGGAKPYELQVVGVSPEPIVGSSGVRVVPDRTIADLDEPIDTLLVAGSYAIRSFGSDPAVQAWLTGKWPLRGGTARYVMVR
jgi:transcriptional regulator GlxA family with amidase domain